MKAEPEEGRDERQKAGPAREALESRELRLRGEVRVCVAKRGGALGSRRELLEGRDPSRPPGASWAAALQVVQSTGAPPRGIMGEGISTPGPQTPFHTLGGPAVRCEQASNGGPERGRALERCCTHIDVPLALTCVYLPATLSGKESEW